MKEMEIIEKNVFRIIEEEKTEVINDCSNDLKKYEKKYEKDSTKQGEIARKKTVQFAKDQRKQSEKEILKAISEIQDSMLKEEDDTTSNIQKEITSMTGVASELKADWSVFTEVSDVVYDPLKSVSTLPLIPLRRCAVLMFFCECFYIIFVDGYVLVCLSTVFFFFEISALFLNLFLKLFKMFLGLPSR